ncbi:uncharacterized protein LOC111642050 [Centruroides sculpturatus]|uniref:uncharacterized protein LOC111642050 n=1 Tax=Centruroides sculpturatus TaxID=218467 RepID=UPI000C6D9EE2|nr:uncharacterized protein LOC111642050 [Centruroides sculpturatus]
MIKYSTFSRTSIFIFGTILILKVQGSSLIKENESLAEKIKREDDCKFKNWASRQIIKSLQMLERDLISGVEDKARRLADINNVINRMSLFSGVEGIDFVKPRFARMFHFKLYPFDPCMLDEIEIMIKDFQDYF